MSLDDTNIVDTRDVKVERRKKARRAVNRALRNGVLVRPDNCELCGNSPGRAKNGKALIDAHHLSGYDEEHWLDIIWVCQSCHQKTHARRHGIPHTDEVKAQIGASSKARFADPSYDRSKHGSPGAQNPFFGKHHSSETRQRIGDALRGKKRSPRSEETKKRMSKPRPRVECDSCGRTISSVWIARHKDSGCVVA